MALPSLPTKKKLQIHPAGLLIILLSFGAWVIALGGVGGSQQNCAAGARAAASAGSLAPAWAAHSPHTHISGLTKNGTRRGAPAPPSVPALAPP